MGRIYLFTCPRCEYQAKVSGGPDEGFHFVTQTIVCRDCQALHDAVVRVRVPESEGETKRRPDAPDNDQPPRSRLCQRQNVIVAVPLVLLFGGQKRTRWIQQKPQCPVSRLHRIEIWTAPGKCPRCATYLERTVMPWRIWD